MESVGIDRNAVGSTYKPMQTKTTCSEEFITKKEVAERLKCTERHVDNLTSRGVINRIKVGQLCRFDWAEVSEALKGGC